MALVTIFKQSLQKSYKCTLCSKAIYFFLISTSLALVLPLLLAFKSQGFWHIYDYYREKPSVLFKHQILLIIETNFIHQPIFWSTITHLNENFNEPTRPVTIQHTEWDNNTDGKNDYLDMSIDVSMKDEDQVQGIKLLLFFDYQLKIFSKLKMETLVYINYESSKAGSDLSVKGDLRLYQKGPLKHTGSHYLYNQSVLNKWHLEDFSLGKVLFDYAERNVSTSLQNVYSIWTAGRAQNQPFHIHLRVNFPEETILYQLGFWQLIKLAWMQYLSLLIISLYILKKVKAFVFESHTFCTVVESPLKKQL